MFHRKSIAKVGVSLAALAGIGVVLAGCTQTSGGSSRSAMKKSSYVAPPAVAKEAAPPAWEPPVAEKERRRRRGGARGPFKLPSVATLKNELELSQEQTAAIDKIYADCKELAKATLKKIREAAGEEKKEIRNERRKLRKEIVRKIRKTLDADQKEKLKKLTSRKRK